MSQIKRLLDVLATTPDGELRLVPDEPISLVQPGGTTPVTKAPISLESWRSVAMQLVPPFAFSAFEDDGVLESLLTLGGRNFFVRLERDAGGHCLASVRLTRPALDITSLTQAAPVDVVVLGPVGGGAVYPDALEAMERLLRRQMEMGASDLHLRSGAVPLARHNGDIVPLEDEAPIPGDLVLAMVQSIMPEQNRRDFAESSDVDFAYEIADTGRFRINVFRDRLGPGLVARSIPSRIVSAGELGLSAEVRALAHLSKGLVLVTGPTGSGKSTTLSALVDLVNATRRDHIVTIEDPIEFVHVSKGCLVTQRQVGAHTGSFKQALRAALREDPDVVLVGELRDLETVSIAIETAETGHLVFGTLHTSTAASTVDRIIDQFPPDRQSQVRVMLSESLKGVVSQTLCRKIGGGRVAAMEILLVTPALSNLIREGKTFQMTSIMQTSRKLGMVTMTDALVSLVEKQLVEPKEAYLKAPDKSAIVQGLKSRGFDVSFAEADTSAPAAPATGTRTPVGAGRR
ncbi:MAG: type IV pilus twitching motility protein PilT [Gemmatimonadaceae bacterium]